MCSHIKLFPIQCCSSRDGAYSCVLDMAFARQPHHHQGGMALQCSAPMTVTFARLLPLLAALLLPHCTWPLIGYITPQGGMTQRPHDEIGLEPWPCSSPPRR
jgi:hypothetical protein